MRQRLQKHYHTNTVNICAPPPAEGVPQTFASDDNAGECKARRGRCPRTPLGDGRRRREASGGARSSTRGGHPPLPPISPAHATGHPGTCKSPQRGPRLALPRGPAGVPHVARSAYGGEDEGIPIGQGYRRGQRATTAEANPARGALAPLARRQHRHTSRLVTTTVTVTYPDGTENIARRHRPFRAQ